jgi:hypothetical protein
MLRVFGAFLSVFLFLSLLVRMPEMAFIFGLAAIGLFAADLAATRVFRISRSHRMRGEPFI